MRAQVICGSLMSVSSIHASGLRFQGIHWRSGVSRKPESVVVDQKRVRYQTPDGRTVIIDGPERRQLDEIINGAALKQGDHTSLKAQVRAFVEQARPESITRAFATKSVHPVTDSPDYEHFVHWNGSRKGLINYRKSHKMALAIGRPLGDLSSADTLKAWTSEMQAQGLIPVMYQVDEEFTGLARKQGFSAIPIGAEALVSTESFQNLRENGQPQGTDFKNIRSSINRYKKQGWQMRDYTDADWPMVEAANEQWLEAHGKAEMDFAMGKLTRQYLADTNTKLLLDHEGKLLAYFSVMELPGNNRRTADLMRVVPGAPSGAMDALIALQLEEAYADGVAIFDLGLSGLARLDEAKYSDKPLLVPFLAKFYEMNTELQKWEDSPSKVQRLIAKLMERLHLFYRYKGLHDFKNKFRPDWQPSYVLFPKDTQFQDVAVSLLLMQLGLH